MGPGCAAEPEPEHAEAVDAAAADAPQLRVSNLLVQLELMVMLLISIFLPPLQISLRLLLHLLLPN